MTFDVRESASHPASSSLALYAAADLPFVRQLQVRNHVWRCPRCEEAVSQFRSALIELRRQANTPSLNGFEGAANWSRLEREMLGNIAVGVAAARCIDNVGRHRSWSRGFLVAASLTVLFVAGWFTHIPREQNIRLVNALRRVVGAGQAQASETLVQSTAGGIAVRTQGATLTLMHPASAVVSLSGGSSVTARYVDEDSGQVTITKVYGE